MPGKHYTKLELLQRAQRAKAGSTPCLGFPEKPTALPRALSREWDRIAFRLHERRILRTTDAQDILNFASDWLQYGKVTERMSALKFLWESRKPGEEPDPAKPEIRTTWHSLPCGCWFLLDWCSLSQQDTANYLQAIHTYLGCEGKGAHRETKHPEVNDNQAMSSQNDIEAVASS